MLPRRGPACRPSARVHPGRYRDVLRGPERCHERARGGPGRRLRPHGCRDAHAAAPHGLLGGHGHLWLRQARYPLWHAPGRPDRHLCQLQVQGLCDCRKRGGLCRQGHQRQGRRCLGTCQDRQARRRGLHVWRQGPGLDRLPRGRLYQQPHRQVLLGRGDGSPARAHGRRARRPCDVCRRPAPAL